MNWIIVSGVKPYDGRYEFDLDGSEFTSREWVWIKRFSGYMPLTVDEGFEGGDPALYASFAIVAMLRGGSITQRDAPDVFERLLDAPFGSSIRIEGDTVAEDDADDPSLSTNGIESDSFSGSDTQMNSDGSNATPNGSGIRVSAGSPSDPLTSGS